MIIFFKGNIEQITHIREMTMKTLKNTFTLIECVPR